MKYLLALFLCGSSLVSGYGQAAEDSVYLFSYFKGNGEDRLHLAYSRDGYTFQALNEDRSFLTPTVSKDKLMRDPCIIRGADGKYHMVWTVSWNDRGLGYARSPDLIHWSEQEFLPVMALEPTALNTWAPELFYDAVGKQYLIYWATTVPGRFPETEGAGDEKYNHRMYYVTTKDFKKFSDTELLYDPGFNVIDATIHRTGRRYVMFLKDETRTPPQKNLKVAYSRQPTKGWGPAGAPITGDYWAEGPTATQVDGKWIVYFDKYRDHRMGAVQSEDLEHWTDISDRVHFPEGTRHGSVFKVPVQALETLQKSLPLFSKP